MSIKAISSDSLDLRVLVRRRFSISLREFPTNLWYVYDDGYAFIKKVRQHIGVLPEYTDLYEGLTALEHIAYLSKITGTRQKTSDYEELLEFVGLHHYHQEKVGTFTPGMKKRLEWRIPSPIYSNLFY